jgi:hypothetical protein
VLAELRQVYLDTEGDLEADGSPDGEPGGGE